MSRYRGPRFKKIRRLGALPGLTSQDLKNQFSSRKKSGYCVRLEEKQKLRFHYGLTERQLLRYVHMARKAKGSTGQVLLQLLEMRLDNILFRLDMALTIPNARQLVNHRHILVNGRIVDIPSYRCKPRDIITTKEKEKSHILVQNSIEKRRYQRILIEKERLEKERLEKERLEKERLEKEEKEEEKEEKEEEKEEERYEILVLKNWIEKEEKEKKKKPKCQQFVVPKKLPDHLTLDSYQSKYKGFVKKIIDSQSACLKIKELLVVEYYSRQT